MTRSPTLASGENQFLLESKGELLRSFSCLEAKERFLLLSLAFAQEKVTKEKSARLAPVRSLRKMQSIFLRCAPLPPPPRGAAVGSAVIRATADQTAVLNRLRGRHSPPKRREKGTRGDVPGRRGTLPGNRGMLTGAGRSGKCKYNNNIL